MKHLPRHAAAACCAALLLAGPAGHAQTPTAPVDAPASSAAAQGTVQPTVFTLDNGMTLIVKPDHRAPTAVHMVWVRVGAMDEGSGSSGIAHALAHLMFKGTTKLGPGEFSRRVAEMGGRENAFTGRDYTGYYQQIPANRLEDVMKLE